MQIIFGHDKQIQFELKGPMTFSLERMYKHLQYVPLPWRNRDNPYFETKFPVQNLIDTGKLLGISVDHQLCNEQSYLNYLHELYERQFDGRPEWLDFNEYIHLCERKKTKKILILDHRELAGLVTQSVNHSWLTNGITQVPMGTVFVRWNELGKSPHEYWVNNEPNNPLRLRELAKPWITLHSKIEIALEDIDFMSNIDKQSFNSWWQLYQKDWCNHWGLNCWSIEQQVSVVPIGKLNTNQCEKIIEWLNQGLNPTYVRL